MKLLVHVFRGSELTQGRLASPDSRSRIRQPRVDSMNLSHGNAGKDGLVSVQSHLSIENDYRGRHTRGVHTAVHVPIGA